jgi:hypothetical protein
MAGLVSAIHAFLLKGRKKNVDTRKDGHPAALRGGAFLRRHDDGDVIDLIGTRTRSGKSASCVTDDDESCGASAQQRRQRAAGAPPNCQSRGRVPS